MIVYDNYEISGCHRLDKKGRPHPNGHDIETCDDSEAQFWTLYGHIDGEGVEAIGDFSTREHAEETFQRIAGIPFTGSREVAARLRVMHAAPKLLSALQWLVDNLVDAAEDRNPATGEEYDTVANVRAVIAEAKGRSA